MNRKVTHIIPLDDIGKATITGGAELHLRDLLKAQAAEGCDVELIVLLLREGPSVRDFLADLRSSQIPVTILKVKKYFPKTTLLANGMRLASLLRHRRTRILHAHLDYAAKALVVARMFCRYSKAVLTIHNDEPYYRGFIWRWRWAIFSRIFKKMLAISDHVRTYMTEKVGVSAARMVCVPHGLPVLDASLEKTELRHRFGIAEDSWVVGFVGRLCQQKNPRMLVRALALMPEGEGVFVGDGELRGALEAEVADLGARAVFLGSVPNAGEIMPLFDVFCLTSRWEGFGIVLLEAMRAGVPVVGTDAGAIPEVLEDAGIIVPSEDCQALADALMKIKSNPVSARELGQKGRERFRAGFTLDSQVSNLNEIYDEVLDS